MYKFLKRSFALLTILLTAEGCVSIHHATPRAYFGPTETMQQVVTAVDTNNKQITSLWARVGYFEANVQDERGGKAQFVNGEGGYLLMRKPGELRLRADKAAIGPVLDVGANQNYFWLVAPPADRAWWGNRVNAGKPCVEQMPISPVSVMEVLGVSNINLNFLQSPMPVMRFNNDADAYMFTWQKRSMTNPARMVVTKEVWYDRQTKRPELVNLFDENGRIVVRAYLSNYQPVGQTSAEMATTFQLLFPDSGSRFTFSINEMKLSNGKAPNDLSFSFNPARTGVHEVEQMDRNCK